MDTVVKQGGIVEQAVDLIVVNLFQGVSEPGGATGAVDKAVGGRFSPSLRPGISSVSPARRLCSTHAARIPAPRVLVVGLGEPAKLGANVVRAAAATAARKARDLGAKTFATIVHGAGIGGLDAAIAAGALVEGTRLGLYRFEGYRSKPPKDWKPSPETMTIVEMAADRLPAIEAGVAHGEAVAAGVMLARDLVNTPANLMTPTIVAERAEALARATGLNFEALGRAKCKALGMGIFMAVAEESEQEPKLIILGHNAERADLPTLVLVGKGVTFDSGGISIKPSEEMWRMKGDMAGAAAVIAALGIAARSACRCA